MNKLKQFYKDKLKNNLPALEKMPKSQLCVYITVLTLPILLMSYQGCQTANIDTMSEVSEDKEASLKNIADPIN